MLKFLSYCTLSYFRFFKKLYHIAVYHIYKKTKISERHRHRYEVNFNYIKTLEKFGLCFSGMSPDGKLPEIFELENHPWYIGVQFHPELKSRPFDPHPLFISFIKAAIQRSKLF